jgi:hypothetical protein
MVANGSSPRGARAGGKSGRRGVDADSGDEADDELDCDTLCDEPGQKCMATCVLVMCLFLIAIVVAAFRHVEARSFRPLRLPNSMPVRNMHSRTSLRVGPAANAKTQVPPPPLPPLLSHLEFGPQPESVARGARLVIGALFQDSVRDGGDELRSMYFLMKQTVSGFQDHVLMLLENDSADGTAEAMRKLCREDGNTLCFNMMVVGRLSDMVAPVDRSHPGPHSPFKPSRFARIAFFRNELLRQAKRLLRFDYFVFADGDLLGIEWLPKVKELTVPHTVAPWLATGGASCVVPESDAAGSLRIGGKARAWQPNIVHGMLGRAAALGLAGPWTSVSTRAPSTPESHTSMTTSTGGGSSSSSAGGSSGSTSGGGGGVSTRTSASSSRSSAVSFPTTQVAAAEPEATAEELAQQSAARLSRDTKAQSTEQAEQAERAKELKAKEIEYAQLRRRRHPAGQATAICAHGTFSSRRLQYDLLALRLNERTPIPAAALRCDPEADYRVWNHRFSAPEIYNNRSTVEELVASMALFGFSKDQGFVPVDSCFGGLTIYSLPALVESGCMYDETTSDCEHVSFNRCLLERYPGSIFLDTAATVFYDTAAWET